MSLKSEDPRGMSPRELTTGGPFDTEPIVIEDQTYGPVKEEPQDVRSTRKPKAGTLQLLIKASTCQRCFPHAVFHTWFSTRRFPQLRGPQ